MRARLSSAAPIRPGGTADVAGARVAAAARPKLRISVPGDRSEREADQLANTVLRMAVPGRASGAKPGAMCSDCEDQLSRQATDDAAHRQEDREEEDETAPASPGGMAPGMAAVSGASPAHPGPVGSGRPLANDLRAFFEPRFGHDFSRIRVHNDQGAAQAADAVEARAYTLGDDVVFGEGEYAPGSDQGRRLLAHELAHVVQQDTGGTAGSDPAVIRRQPLVEHGATGCPVPELQDSLNQTGEALAVDGRFGRLTLAAVRRFQRAHPPLAVDGDVGPLTWAALHAAAPGDWGLPTGELTFPSGWGAGANETIQLWLQELTPDAGTTTFEGCQVTEADTGGGSDTCHFAGSAFAPFTAVTGGTWDVDVDNFWGEDFVGWFAPAVTYYRSQGRAPCTATFPQSMRVVRPSGDAEYRPNILAGTIGTTTVSSTRDGNTETRNWP